MMGRGKGLRQITQMPKAKSTRATVPNPLKELRRTK